MAGGQQGSPLFFLGGLSHGGPPLCPHGVLRLPFSSPCLRGNGKEGLAERSLFSQREHPLSLHLTPGTANPSTKSEGHRQHQSHARLHGQCHLPSHPSFPAVFPSVLLKGHTASPSKFSLGSSGTASYLSHSFLALPGLLSSPHSPDWNRENSFTVQHFSELILEGQRRQHTPSLPPHPSGPHHPRPGHKPNSCNANSSCVPHLPPRAQGLLSLPPPLIPSHLHGHKGGSCSTNACIQTA